MEQIQAVSQPSHSNLTRSDAGGNPRLSWATWIVDGALFIAAIVGACYAWPIQSEAGRLHAKRLELQRRVGEMPIQDPSKYHVLLLDSENPLEFRWRIYIPAKTATMLSTESRSSTGSSVGTSSFSGSADPAYEGLVSATILPSQNNSNIDIKIHIRSLHSRGSTTLNIFDDSIKRQIQTKDTSSWRIAGRGAVEMLSVDELLCLLAIEPPKSNTSQQVGLLRIGLGTQAVIDKARNE